MPSLLQAVKPSTFWARVKQGSESECWEWQGPRMFPPNMPYGVVNTPRSRGAPWSFRSHRVAWELTHGAITDPALCVCHHCDNPPCCNPKHLFLGTQADNTEDMFLKGREKYLSGDEHWSAQHPEYLQHMPRGEDNKNHRLKTEEVVRIRALYATKKYSYRDLEPMFGVSDVTIMSVVLRRTWKHVVP